jgi:hypothetical protein
MDDIWVSHPQDRNVLPSQLEWLSEQSWEGLQALEQCLPQLQGLIAEAHTIRDLWVQAAAAAAEKQGNTAEAERLSRLAADRVERAWGNHADLVKRRNAARASTNQRKAAARQAQQPDALDGTESTIRDTSLMLLARLPLHSLHQGLEKLEERPAAKYSTAGTLYHLDVDGKEAAERVRLFVVPKLDNLKDILTGRTICSLPAPNDARSVANLARAHPVTGPVLLAVKTTEGQRAGQGAGRRLLAERGGDRHADKDHHRCGAGAAAGADCHSLR